MGIPCHSDNFDTGEPLAETSCPVISCSELTNLVFIGKGSFCCVYSAIYNEVPVAVKFCRPDVDRAVGNNTLITELEILAHIDHPHIVKVKGYGWNHDDESSDMFLVLELIHHGTLGDLLAEGKSHSLSLSQSVGIAIQLSGAIKYLEMDFSNEYGVLHRDLKPDNVGINNGKVKLMDFGLARAIRTNGKLGQMYEMTGNCGTFRYMAPEVAKGLHYNEKCEVYSFGLIFWQMLTGAQPFNHKTHDAWVKDVIEGGNRPAIPESCPFELSHLIQQMWHPDPGSRPSFEEINDILLNYQRKSISHQIVSIEGP